MHKEDCIFCKISKNEIPSYRIGENEEFFAILDIFPNTKGMTLVVPKNHYDSYAFNMPDDVYTRFLLFAKNIGKELDEKLGVERTALVMEGMGVNHAHIKLYPLHGLGKEFKMITPEGNIYFDKYEGYLTTKLGPKASDNQLEELKLLFKR
jgi:histidine triad (HIT) family protein